MDSKLLPVAVIGAGPVGLAAAAHLRASGRRFVLFEAGESVGANIRGWGHVRLFSPWRYNIDKEAERLLMQHNIQLPSREDLPSGHELVDQYLAPLASLPEIREQLHLNTHVLSITRKGLDKVRTDGREELPFSIQVKEEGEIRNYEAHAVIDASGTWGNPNPLGSGGVPAVGERENHARINYAIPDILGADEQRYANKTVLVVGSGHSAINSIFELHQLALKSPSSSVHWILRKQHVSQVYGGGHDDALQARGEMGIRIERLVRHSQQLHLHFPVFIHQVVRDGATLTVRGIKGDAPFALRGIDEIIANTGARPELSFLREVRFDTDAALECVPALAELIDPNIHSCGTVRPHGEAELRQKEKDFYIVGAKSYGRAPTFLMVTGYEQVRSVVAHLNGDETAARRVELDLPQTGVCRVGIPARSILPGMHYQDGPHGAIACDVGCDVEKMCLALDAEEKEECHSHSVSRLDDGLRCLGFFGRYNCLFSRAMWVSNWTGVK